jgi:D-cysteine desulfhydrase family pyridoxal phosphate-dependent enzyme
MDIDQFPRFPLAHAPTPLEPLERLQRFLGGPRLYIKRDDCTGLATGGNKTRKLEFLIGEALKIGATAVVSARGLQSNHVRQTAAAAAKAGLKCYLVLDHKVPIDTEAYRATGNFLLDRLLGAVTHICAPGETRAGKTEDVMLDLRARGENPYNIPVGGSNEVGALGYVSMLDELLRQAKDARLHVDRIVVASSSGGTQAGLVTGRALAQADVAITGIDVDGEPEILLAKVQSIASECALRLGLRQETRPEVYELVRGYAAPGYGQPNTGMIEAVKFLASLEGILLDPVYTGKAMAGLIDMIRKGRFAKDEAVVFVHTGGTPALSAYADRF